MRAQLLPILALAGMFALGACGTSQPSADDDAAAADPQPITLTDAADRTVELDAPADRVVVLEWQQVEDVLTLGVEPVGVADVEGYNTWDTAEELDPDTTDVGARGEPNMDAVFSTNPDLVIVEFERGSPLIRQLEKYDVPVLVTKGADAEDPIANMKATFTLIAQALGKEDKASEVLDAFDAHLADARQTIADADLETTEFAFIDAYLDGSNVSIRPFGQGSLVGELGEAIGLTNVWKGDVDEAYGLGTTDVEGLTAIGDAHLFFTSTDALTDAAGYEPWMPALEQNAIWRNAAFVEADRVHPFPSGVWTFGGPGSSQQVVDAFVDALT
ncbi:MAG: iron-siderophore transporter substrate-binding protein [Nocardioidaceae bacterium]|jgi:iron complex transport system substrate-binding protein|nr:iron-siderophore transporter substrate-binding protein [Nocardioidaceae bacterium]